MLVSLSDLRARSIGGRDRGVYFQYFRCSITFTDLNDKTGPLGSVGILDLIRVVINSVVPVIGVPTVWPRPGPFGTCLVVLEGRPTGSSDRDGKVTVELFCRSVKGPNFEDRHKKYTVTTKNMGKLPSYSYSHTCTDISRLLFSHYNLL